MGTGIFLWGNKMSRKLKQDYFRVSPYNSLPSGEVVFESSTPGTYSFTPPNSRLYKITIVGAGGGAAAFRLKGPGGMQIPQYLGAGSGGLSIYTGVEMLQSRTYTIIVGQRGNGVDGGALASDSGVTVYGQDGGTSSISSIGSASGGTGAVLSAAASGPKHVGYGGAGITQNGNDGQARTDTQAPAPGGASVYNGHGEGGTGYFNSPYVSSGTAGYVKIETI